MSYRMRPRLIEMLGILKKSYEWRAAKYEEDSDGWKKSGNLRLADYYLGRSKEADVTVKEIEEIIESLKLT